MASDGFARSLVRQSVKGCGSMSTCTVITNDRNHDCRDQLRQSRPLLMKFRDFQVQMRSGVNNTKVKRLALPERKVSLTAPVAAPTCSAISAQWRHFTSTRVQSPCPHTSSAILLYLAAQACLLWARSRQAPSTVFFRAKLIRKVQCLSRSQVCSAIIRRKAAYKRLP